MGVVYLLVAFSAVGLEDVISLWKILARVNTSLGFYNSPIYFCFRIISPQLYRMSTEVQRTLPRTKPTVVSLQLRVQELEEQNAQLLSQQGSGL